LSGVFTKRLYRSSPFEADTRFQLREEIAAYRRFLARGGKSSSSNGKRRRRRIKLLVTDLGSARAQSRARRGEPGGLPLAADDR